MTDLAHKYKEVSPEQTIANVEKFFADLGIEIVPEEDVHSEIDTWGVHYDLYKDGVFLFGANGKGMTKEYSRASGHAELYERYCNGNRFWVNDILIKKLMNYNKEHYGYYFDKNEKILTYEEAIKSISVNQWLVNTFGTKKYDQKKLIDFYTNEQYIGVPFINVADKNDIEYIDPRLAHAANRSNGMVAGNTIEEALCQGISELYERMGEYSFLSSAVNQEQFTYYELNLNNIEIPADLRHSIDKFKENGHVLHIYDLSYNFNVPTLVSVLVDREYGVVNMNFGAFPVFEIALERVLTELYQNIDTFKKFKAIQKLVPFKENTYGTIMREYGNAIDGSIFPEFIIKNTEIVNSYNHDIFIDKDCSNKDCLNQLIEIANMNGLKLYYKDNSLTDTICAAYIICENIPQRAQGNPILNFDGTQINKIIQSFDLLKSFENSLENKVENTNLLFNVAALSFENFFDPCFYGMLQFHCWLHPLDGKGGDYFFFSNLLRSGSIEDSTLQMLDRSMYLKQIKKWYYILRYKQTESYSNDEILTLCNELFNFNVTIEDLNNCQSIEYVAKDAFYKIRFSKEFDDLQNFIVKSFHKK